MKKILLSALASTVLSGATLAGTPCFNGAYLGAGLDYMQEKFKVSGIISASKSVKGAGFKIFGGYGTIIADGFYFGGELTLGMDRVVGSEKDKDLDANKKANYGIAARAGYVFSNVLPYVKAGYEGRPSFKVYNVLNVRRNGFILGAGADFAVTNNVFVRAEYVHGFGSKTNTSVTVRNVAANLSTKPSTDTFLIGAGYKF
jgi:opacity protein-like surface antigen